MPKLTKMEKFLICLTEHEAKWLRNKAEDSGLSMSEIIRRLADKEMGKE